MLCIGFIPPGFGRRRNDIVLIFFGNTTPAGAEKPLPANEIGCPICTSALNERVGSNFLSVGEEAYHSMKEGYLILSGESTWKCTAVIAE
ncbi:MAG: hypothetical protein CVU57_30090 [Deltaproteobacteria bacterium HGW-Deltaproteobacteria-15]|jgi:hypothetical protein|nr:MAG: hypothetical protein CVU57_30090 [Deltaproteobacteria bacterium HGW-Deltaproteobacteria-15]